MIKRIVVKNLNTSLKFLALGKIKFYDCDGVLIESGSVTNDTSLIGETDNFKCSVNGSYVGSYPISIINTNTNSDHWLSNAKNDVSIEIYFKNYVDSISRISIIPLPGNLSTNGITESFDIDVYDDEDNIIYSYNITPTKIRGEEQIITTNELVSYYILSDSECMNTTNPIRLNNLNMIKYIKADQFEPHGTAIRYLFSIDDRKTWFVIKEGIIKEVSVDSIILEGMTKIDIESITNYKFNDMVNLDIMVGLNTTNILHGPIVRNVLIYYI